MEAIRHGAQGLDYLTNYVNNSGNRAWVRQVFRDGTGAIRTNYFSSKDTTPARGLSG